MDPSEFRRQALAAVELAAQYLDRLEERPVRPAMAPGDLRRRLPASPPAGPEPMESILADFDELIVPATTHWAHPSFFAYFGSSGSGPGALGEFLAAVLNVNAMLWRTGPAATELEEHVLDWLRQLIGLPQGWFGVINDTASSSTLFALAAARELAPELRIRELGMAGRGDLQRLRVYCSDEAHSSVHKAVITLGLGLEGLRQVPTDDELRLDPAALERAIAEDRAAGIRPLAVVATVGTTSTTSVDPVAAMADICGREGMWLHVDAAYAGSAAILPEMRWLLDGCERADSLVLNPHKWLFVPVDCSALYTRRPDVLRRAFQLTPEYLTTPETGGATNLMDYGIPLGRRFRALKLWFVLRHFGAEGLRERLREHLRLARLFAGWVDGHERFERLAPAPMSVVVFRHRPPGLAEGEELDRHNAALLERLNAGRELFLSHTQVRGRYALRFSVGNLRTEEKHVRSAWERLLEATGEAA